jgi:hypothetical protein
MEYTTIELKVPVGSEQEVRDLAMVAIKRFLARQMQKPPVTETVEYKKEVETYEKANLVAQVVIKPVEKPLPVEKNIIK